MVEDRIIAEGKFIRVVDRNSWEFVDRMGISGIVVIIGLTSDKEIILVEQLRIPVGQRVIELPAGLAGDRPGEEDESFVKAAERELLEETGFEAEEMHFVTSGPPSPGVTTEIVSFFFALGLRKVGEGGGDATEDIRTHVVPLDDIENWLADAMTRGLLVDPKVYAGLYFCRSHFDTEKETRNGQAREEL